MSLLNAPAPKDLSHTTLDTIHGVRVFCSGPEETVAGERALPLGHATFAPARSVSVTGEALAVVLRIFPRRADGDNVFVTKGLDQYRIVQSSEGQLCFSLHTDAPVCCAGSIPDDWYDSWHTIAAVYDGECAELAVDGVLLASVPAWGSIRYAPGACSVGFDPFTGATAAGAVAAIQIYGEIPVPAIELSAQPRIRTGCSANVVFDGLEPVAQAGLETSPTPTAQIIRSEPANAAAGPALTSLPPLEIHEKDNVGYFSGEGFAIEIDLPTATITSWQVNDEELLELGPVHQFWRPPGFSEMRPVKNGPSIAAQWVEAGYSENLMGTTAMEALQESPHCVTLEFQGLIIRRNSDVLFEVSRRYTLYGDGEVVMAQELTPKIALPPLGRLGLELRVPKTFDAYQMGTTSSTDKGGAVEARWVALQDASGYGLLAWSDLPFWASLSPYSAFQLSEAHYPSTLTADSAHTLHIDEILAVPPPDADDADLASYGIPVQPLKTTLRMRGVSPADRDLGVFVNRGLPR